MRLFDDNFDIRSLHTKYIKAKIKSVIKNDFYNINIENLLIVEDEDLIKQISHVSYKDLLEFDNTGNFNNIRVHNNNKILNITLN